MAQVRWLTDSEDRAWRGYRRLRALLDLQVSRDLLRDSGLSDADYDVLSTVSESRPERLRQSELATRMRWSASRTSHHVARMEERGLVRREECPEDGRGAVVSVTDAGWQALKEAAALHVESVRRHLIDLLSPDQIAVLGDITEVVLTHLSEHDAAAAGRTAEGT